MDKPKSDEQYTIEYNLLKRQWGWKVDFIKSLNEMKMIGRFDIRDGGN